MTKKTLAELEALYGAYEPATAEELARLERERAWQRAMNELRLAQQKAKRKQRTRSGGGTPSKKSQYEAIQRESWRSLNEPAKPTEGD